MMSDTNTIQSFVTKEFLINIITRDIEIMDAILELIDNSLDRAIEKYEIDVTKGLIEDYNIKSEVKDELKINIRIDKDEIIIEDNCGGIQKDKLEKEVFIFGTPKENEYQGLSAFGIGMKRAFFKLGKIIELRTKTDDQEAGLIWDVKKWMVDTPWNLEFADLSKLNIEFNNGLPGTIILIKDLNESVKTRFSQTEFIESLKKRLSTGYALFIKAGIQFFVNEVSLVHTLPNFFTSDEINITSKPFEDGEVKYRIIAGITPPEDRIPRGWYVFCNGRMVLESDKSSKTGWGDRVTFHPKFNHFVGYVSFTSENVQLLPWSSTKWGIEPDSEIYIRALEEMKLQAQPILNVLDRWRDIKDDDEEIIKLKDLLKDGKSTPVFSSAKQDMIFEYKPKQTEPITTRITFIREKALVEKVKISLGDKKMSNVACGELVFDYYVENEL